MLGFDTYHAYARARDKSSLLTRIAGTVNASLCVRMKR